MPSLDLPYTLHTPRPPPTPPRHRFFTMFTVLCCLSCLMMDNMTWPFFRPDGGCMKRVFAICLPSGLILVKTWAWDGCSSADVPPVYDKHPVNKVKAKDLGERRGRSEMWRADNETSNLWLPFLRRPHQAGAFASSRDFMRQRWIFWKACGSVLLTYLCDASRSLRKYVDRLSKLIENIQDRPANNHSWCCNNASCAIICCNLVFRISEPCIHKHLTWV